jgi:hypothetical protein
MPSFSDNTCLNVVALAVIHAAGDQNNGTGRIEANFGVLVVAPAAGGHGGGDADPV